MNDQEVSLLNCRILVGAKEEPTDAQVAALYRILGDFAMRHESVKKPWFTVAGNDDGFEIELSILANQDEPKNLLEDIHGVSPEITSVVAFVEDFPAYGNFQTMASTKTAQVDAVRVQLKEASNIISYFQKVEKELTDELEKLVKP